MTTLVLLIDVRWRKKAEKSAKFRLQSLGQSSRGKYCYFWRYV